MQAILPILEFIQSILTKPAWIMGLFAFVGLVALKRPAHKVMTGTLKPILGYIMRLPALLLFRRTLLRWVPSSRPVSTSPASCPTTRSSFRWLRASSAFRP